jgi:uncharacterized protein (TIGR00725 family)
MTSTFKLDRVNCVLHDDGGRSFEPATRSWVALSLPTGGAFHFDEGIDTMDAVAAATWLQRDSGSPCRVPVGVIGPRAATGMQVEVAEAIGRGIAAMGLVVVCGGRDGVMAAVSKGCRSGGGTTVGLLPETDPGFANPYIDIAIATGIGEARNALIARASICLVAVGNSYGTLSEVALARHFGKLVIGLEGAAQVEGVRHVADARTALTLVAECVLGRSS